MEFSEKLQELRKSRGLTQEELAEALYVSRTAVSKWESGRGLPNIDSLKEIAKFFSVTIDELLSAERILTIAEKENRNNLKSICDLLLGILDFLSLTLILLPLYPKPADGYVFSVNLLSYTNAPAYKLTTYWILFSALILIGCGKIILSLLKIEKGQKPLTIASVCVSILSVLFLGMAREPYAVTLSFLLLAAKTAIIFKSNEQH